jgi:hypothetical protein
LAAVSAYKGRYLPPPLHRFPEMMQKASECSQLSRLETQLTTPHKVGPFKNQESLFIGQTLEKILRIFYRFIAGL